MSLSIRAEPATRWLVGVGALGVALGATLWLSGTDTGISAALLVSGLGLAALALAAILHPSFALVLLVVVVLSNTSSVVGYVHGLSVYTATLVLAVCSLAFGLARRSIRLCWSPVYLLAGIYLACQVPSLVQAQDAALAYATLANRAKDVLLLVVIGLLATAVPATAVSERAVAAASTERLLLLARTSVAVMGALAALSVLHQFVFSGAGSFFGYSNIPKAADLGGVTGRHSGPVTDPDFWARSLTAFFPVAWALWAAKVPLLRGARGVWIASHRWWLVAFGCIGVGVFLTSSRGGMLAAAIAVVVALGVAGVRYRRLLWLMPVAVPVLLLIPGVGSRLLTLSQVGGAVTASAGDASLIQRAAAQEIGLAMVRHRPALGVGLGNFATAWDQYATDATTAVLRQVAPHNLYLQAAAEGGLLGLSGLLILGVGCLVLAGRALFVAHTGRYRVLSAGILAGLAGWLAASVVLHLGFLRVFFVAAVLAAATDIAVRRQAAALGTPPTMSAVPAAPGASWRRHVPVGAAVLVAVGVLAAGWMLGWAQVHRYSATDDAYLVPRGQERTAPSAYTYGLLDRSFTLPSYATIVDVGVPDALRNRGAAATVAVSASTTNAVVTVEATAQSRASAVADVTSVLRHGQALVAEAGGMYRLSPSQSPPTVQPVAVLQWSRLGLLALTVLVAAVLCWWFVRRGLPRG